MEKTILEEYLRVLFPEVKDWVKEHSSETAGKSAELAKVYVIVHRGLGPYSYPGQLGPQGGKSEGLCTEGDTGNGNSGHVSFRKPLGLGLRPSQAVLCYYCEKVWHKHPFYPVKKSTNLCYVPRPEFCFYCIL